MLSVAFCRAAATAAAPRKTVCPHHDARRSVIAHDSSVRRSKQYIARKELQKRAKQDYLRRIYEVCLCEGHHLESGETRTAASHRCGNCLPLTLCFLLSLLLLLLPLLLLPLLLVSCMSSACVSSTTTTTTASANNRQTADRVEDDNLVFELQPSSPRVCSELQESDQHAALNRQLAQQIPALSSWQEVQEFVQAHAERLNFLNVVALVTQAAAVQQVRVLHSHAPRSQ